MKRNSVDVTFFINKPLTVNITFSTFTTIDPVDKTVLAKRVQIPLSLGYAITIHKSQGMTSRSVVVNCENCINPGQVGVGIGRAVSSDGLCVLNFKKSLCKEHPHPVKEYYDNVSVGNTNEDLSCCRTKKASQDMEGDDDGGDDAKGDDKRTQDEHVSQYIDSDYSDDDLEYIEIIDSNFSDSDLGDQEHRTFDFVARKALEKCMTDFIDTPAEDNMKKFKDLIEANHTPFQDFYSTQNTHMKNFLNQAFPPNVTYSNKNTKEFFKLFQHYMSSQEYKQSAESLLSLYKVPTNGPEFQLSSCVLFYIEKKNLLSIHEKLELDVPHSKILGDEHVMSPGGRGKVRYVAGYVVAKVRYRISKNLRNALFAKGKEETVKKLQANIKMLNFLCISYEEISHSTEDSESLQETARKQNYREGLTNVTDKTFNFLMHLEKVCRENLSNEYVLDYGKHVFSFVMSKIKKDLHLFEMWVDLFSSSTINFEEQSNDESSTGHDDETVNVVIKDIVNQCENTSDLFESAVSLFVKVNCSQFRRDYLSTLRREKIKALRKKVVNKSKRVSETVNMKFILKDSSHSKHVSHLRLKAEVTQNPATSFGTLFRHSNFHTFLAYYI
ncbi:hypothetical protein FSP39_003146 [Pinctada imbricata]|uniref:Uncharacterized protein n=1 Tax=Pinctada imbricata TaxID=66713 RepID=A0AA89CAI8_PINIB|nr:hypothetical protein FSP39_003146 [Pinctada imbricata]